MFQISNSSANILVLMQIIDKWKWYELIDDQMQIMINEIFNIFKKFFFKKKSCNYFVKNEI